MMKNKKFDIKKEYDRTKQKWIFDPINFIGKRYPRIVGLFLVIFLFIKAYALISPIPRPSFSKNDSEVEINIPNNPTPKILGEKDEDNPVKDKLYDEVSSK